jgi:hypothetical protein
LGFPLVSAEAIPEASPTPGRPTEEVTASAEAPMAERFAKLKMLPISESAPFSSSRTACGKSRAKNDRTASIRSPTTSVSRTRWSGDCARTERGWRLAETNRQARVQVAGVGAVLGVVLGVVEDPPDPLEPLVPPPMFGQSALVPVWVRGVVVPPFDGGVVVPPGATVLGEAEGSGLAAETTATPPATSNSPEIAAVRIARRTPLGLVSTGAAATGATGWMGAGTSGWKGGSMRTPCSRLGRLFGTSLTRSVANAPERHMRTLQAGWAPAYGRRLSAA